MQLVSMFFKEAGFVRSILHYAFFIKAGILFCSLKENPQILRTININLCLNKWIGSIGFDVCWLTDLSNSLEQRLIRGKTEEEIEPAEKVKVLHVLRGKILELWRIYGHYDSVILVPAAVIICMVPSFSPFYLDSFGV